MAMASNSNTSSTSSSSDDDDPWDRGLDRTIELLAPAAGLSAAQETAFRENDADARLLLMHAGFDSLKSELGIASWGKRARIMSVVEEWRKGSPKFALWAQGKAAAAAAATAAPPPELAGGNAVEALHDGGAIRRLQLPPPACSSAAGKRKRPETDFLSPFDQDAGNGAPLLTRTAPSNKVVLFSMLGHWRDGVETVRVDLDQAVARTQDDGVLLPPDELETDDVAMGGIDDDGYSAASLTPQVSPPPPEDQLPIDQPRTPRRLALADMTTLPLPPPSTNEERAPTTTPPPPLHDEPASTSEPKDEATSSGQKRIAPTNIRPLQVREPTPERSPLPPLPPSPPLLPPTSSPARRRKLAPKKLYFGHKSRKVDTLFYGVDVGKEIIHDHEETDNWLFSRGSTPKPPGEMIYVASLMRRLHRRLDGGLGVRTIFNSHLRAAIRYYDPERDYFRKYERPSFTVFDYQPGPPEKVRVHRQDTKTLPDLPQPRKPRRPLEPETIVFPDEPANDLPQAQIDPNANSNHEFDYLLEKWPYLPDADKVFPVYGESGSENEYDEQTWREINEELDSENDAPPKTKKTIRILFSEREVREIVDEAIDEIVSAWRRESLPKLEAGHAYNRWTKARKLRRMTLKTTESQERIQELSRRLGKQINELAGMDWSSKGGVQKMVRSNLALTITDREEAKWMVDLMSRKEAPAKPPPKGSRKNASRGKASGPPLEEHGEDGDDEGEEIASESETPGEEEDDGLSEFIVPDDDEEVLPDAPEDGAVAQIRAEAQVAEAAKAAERDLDSPVDDEGSVSPRVRRGRKRGLTDENDANRDKPEGEPNGRSSPQKTPRPASSAREPSPATPRVKAERPSATPGRRPYSGDVIDLTGSPPPPEPPSHNPSSISMSQSNVINIADSEDEQSHPQSPTRPSALVPNPDPKRDDYVNNVLATVDYSVKQGLYFRLRDMRDPDILERVDAYLKQLHEERSRIGIAGLTEDLDKNWRTLTRCFIAWKFRRKTVDNRYRVPKGEFEQLGKDVFAEFLSSFLPLLEKDMRTNEPGAEEGSQPGGTSPLAQARLGHESQTIGPSQRKRSRQELSDKDSDRTPSSSGVVKKKKKLRPYSENLEGKVKRKQALDDIKNAERRGKARREKAAKEGKVVGGGKVLVNPTHYVKWGDIFIDEKLATSLKDHQIKGVQFMWQQVVASNGSQEEGSRGVGALLAHTMGLGKTLQVITFIHTLITASNAEDPKVYGQVPKHLRKPDLKVLILCPPGLIDNWKDELEHWLPENSVSCRMAASGVDQEIRLASIDEWRKSGGILLIGYHLFRNLINNKARKRGGAVFDVSGGTAPDIIGSKTSEDLDAPHKLLDDERHKAVTSALLKSPDLIVADEAHSLKNSTSQTAEAAGQFQSMSRIAMTGSPLSNNLVEYWTLINWIDDGYLGNLAEFKNKYSLPIEDGLYADSTLADRRQSLKLLHMLKKDIAPKMNRADISVIKDEMPEKTEFLITVPLTDLQMKFYQRYVDELRPEALNQAASKRDMRPSTDLLKITNDLGLICGHPQVFYDHIKERERKIQIKRQDAKNKGLDRVGGENGATKGNDDSSGEMSDHASDSAVDILDPVYRRHQWAEELLDQNSRSLAVHSNKLRIVEGIIKHSKEVDDSVLIFSHSVPTLDMIETHLRIWGSEYQRLDGKTKTNARQNAAKRFNGRGFDVFLISTGAGALGLNLFGANRVIIFDFKWNPTWEQQAVGRAYRLGQSKPVFVYRLLVGGTFEETMWNSIRFKSQLQSRVVDMKEPIRDAVKNCREYLKPPRTVEREEVDAFRGKDNVLGKIMAEHDLIARIALTETFEPDMDDELTTEEKKEAEEMQQRFREDARRHREAQFDPENAQRAVTTAVPPAPLLAPTLAVPATPSHDPSTSGSTNAPAASPLPPRSPPRTPIPRTPKNLPPVRADGTPIDGGRSTDIHPTSEASPMRIGSGHPLGRPPSSLPNKEGLRLAGNIFGLGGSGGSSGNTGGSAPQSSKEPKSPMPKAPSALNLNQAPNRFGLDFSRTNSAGLAKIWKRSDDKDKEG